MNHLLRFRARPPNWRSLRLYYGLLGLAALLAGLTLLAAAPPEKGASHPRVTSVRFWSLGSVTRIAIESTSPLHFRSDRLDNPERIFFDLIGATPQLGTEEGRRIHTIKVNDRLLRQIRVAETERDVTRVVLDLRTDVEVTTSTLENPYRLMIELRLPGVQGLDASREHAPPVTGAKVSRTRYFDLGSLASASNRNRIRRLNAARPVLPNPPSAGDAAQVWSIIADPLALADLIHVSEIAPPAARIRHITVSRHSTHSSPPEPLVIELGNASSPEAHPQLSTPATPGAEGETMVRALGLKLTRVVLDPGHGGQDAGTSGPDGLKEKDIALDIAKRLGALIEQRMGSEVIYTRTDDTFIPLTRRTAIANEKKADLFLSIHVNSSPARSVAGFETFYLNFTTSRNALETAARENAGSDATIFDLQDLVKRIALQDKVDESREFATRIQASLDMLAPRSQRAKRDRGVKRAPFVVLIGASMPSVLAEVGFITNSQDASMMRKPEYRQRIAEALYKGISNYANSLSHFQVARQTSRLGKIAENPTHPR